MSLVRVTPFALAATVAVCALVTAEAVAANVVLDDPEETVTDAGTLSAVLLLFRFITRLPLAALVPLQAPDAVQLVALATDQLSVLLPPLNTVVGLAENEITGACTTVTLTACDVLPPGPVQVSVKLVVAESAPLDWLPAVGKAPLQPPDAKQDVALADDQVRMLLAPLATARGEANSVTTGKGSTPTPGYS